MKPLKSFFQAVLLASFGMLASCVADDINVNDSHKGNDMLCFHVNSIQDNATRAMNNVRAATGDYALAFKKYLSVQGLSPKSLVLRKLPVAGHSGMCLIESTEAGGTPFSVGNALTRAQICDKVTKPFYVFGFNGPQPFDEPNSKNEMLDGTSVNPDGTTNIQTTWKSNKPYGLFYAVYNHLYDQNSSATAPKLKYVEKDGKYVFDYEVPQDVRKQGDLLTSRSKEVNFQNLKSGDKITLDFYHALTAIWFKIGEDVYHGVYKDKKIVKIEIVDAFGKGTCVMPQKNDNGVVKWTNQNSPTTFTLNNINLDTFLFVGCTS